jgi:hypothetical protein
MDQLMFNDDPFEVVLLVDYSSVDGSKEDPNRSRDACHRIVPQHTTTNVAGTPTPITGSQLKLKLDEYKLLDLRDTPKDDKPRMLAAIAKEIQDLINVGCFELVAIPDDRQAIPSRIVLKVKYKADGTYDKHKARLVAKGFMERLGSDFFSTYSPMASMSTARALMAIAVHHNLPIMHSDIPQAFIKSLIDTDIWLRLPPGVQFVDQQGQFHHIAKLVRSLYGLRQSPLLFNKELVRFMLAQDYVQTNADSCLFSKQTKNGWVLVASEVDDLLVTGNDNDEIERLHQALVKEYQITDWDPISSFLGININYDPVKGSGNLTMDVEYKIDELFKKHAMLCGHLKGKADTAMLEEHRGIEDSRVLNHVDEYIKARYASLNGALIYMGITCRPDLTYALAKTSKGMHDPKARHVVMLRHLLSYVYRTKGEGLCFDQKPAMFDLLKDVAKTDASLAFMATSDGQHVRRFAGFADANFADIRDDERKSNTGFIFFLYGCAVSWRSKLQPITATSTHEAELIACATAAQEALWLRKLLGDIGFAFDLPLLNLRDENQTKDALAQDGISVPSSVFKIDPLYLFNDNLGTVQTINRPESSSQRSKHIDTRYYSVRQYVKEQKLAVAYLGTEFNIADFFTKALTKPKFDKFKRKIGMRDVGN